MLSVHKPITFTYGCRWRQYASKHSAMATLTFGVNGPLTIKYCWESIDCFWAWRKKCPWLWLQSWGSHQKMSMLGQSGKVRTKELSSAMGGVCVSGSYSHWNVWPSYFNSLDTKTTRDNFFAISEMTTKVMILAITDVISSLINLTYLWLRRDSEQPSTVCEETSTSLHLLRNAQS